MLSIAARRVGRLLRLFNHATIGDEDVAGRVLADVKMLAGLRRRDGALPRRPNPHDDGDACPYAHIYDDGSCPWCRVRSTYGKARQPSHRLQQAA